MTEEEAKMKWCPMARVVIDAVGYASGNRFGGTDEGKELYEKCVCIASDCMMWVVEPNTYENMGEGGRCGLVK